MSWQAIIDQMKDWVQAQGYLTTSYVDRGDPAAADYTNATLTVDGNWHELDLSAIVPAGAKAIGISAFLETDVIERFARFRRHGNFNSVNTAAFATQVANLNMAGDLVVNIDSDRKIDYLIDASGFVSFAMAVKGWWF